MQMRQALDDLLCQRYPALYAGRHGDTQVTAMGYGFEIGDGWFGIIDALSEVLLTRARVERCPCPEARQVKQKFGSLRFHVDAPDKDCGAIDLAEEMSRRVCEVSGRPGRLCRIGEREFATLAPGVELPRKGPGRAVTVVDVGVDSVTREMDIPPLGFSLDDMAKWRADVLAGPVDVPTGWHDLADAILRVMQRKTDSPGDRGRRAGVQRIWRDDAGLRLDWTEGGSETRDLSAMAAALSRRIDPLSGTMIAVDDQGRTIQGRET